MKIALNMRSLPPHVPEAFSVLPHSRARSHCQLMPMHSIRLLPWNCTTMLEVSAKSETYIAMCELKRHMAHILELKLEVGVPPEVASSSLQECRGTFLKGALCLVAEPGTRYHLCTISASRQTDARDPAIGTRCDWVSSRPRLADGHKQLVAANKLSGSSSRGVLGSRLVCLGVAQFARRNMHLTVSGVIHVQRASSIACECLVKQH